MVRQLPYCGAAPLPGDLLTRFNLDPWLLATLGILCVCHLLILRRRRGAQGRHTGRYALGGWLVAAAALVSPLCALSVALFSARVSQHMILILVAAPLLAIGMPRSRARSWQLWASSASFFFALWFWHMPIPYGATFSSVSVYWAMHLTLFGSSVWLWGHLLNHSPYRAGQVLAAGTLTFMHMGLLGAVLAFADRPLYSWHLLTTEVWGLAPLQDQQLGGVIMWVPGIALFLWTAMRSIARLWESIERARPA